MHYRLTCRQLKSACLVVLMVCLSACSKEVPVLTGATMGTTYSVIVPDLKTSDQETLQKKIEASLAELNSAMSTWQPDSAISLFNNSANTDWVKVPESFAIVAQGAIRVASESNGAFDPTVGPLVKRWGFGKAQTDSVPGSDEINALLEQVGYNKLQADVGKSSIRKSEANLQVDLNAIAKGYAVDQLAVVVESLGYTNYLVEIGGELRVNGKNADNEPWRVGIEQPAQDERRASIGLLLDAGSVATSGDYRNSFENDGVRYSHVIDPRVGYPVQHGLASVTVVAESAMAADAWATALMVLGSDDGMKIADKHQLASFFIVRDGQGFVTFSSAAFDKLARTDIDGVKQ